MKILFLFLLFAAGGTALAASDFRFSSEPTQTSLIELYTSEGCSSCPPAEAWLSQLKSNPQLWKQIVPVAFHVDYWDRLGWRDRYAQPEFTQRQSHYAALWASSSVYTPAFVLNGREWRDWSGQLPSPNEQRTGRLTARSSDGKTWNIDYQPAKDSKEEWDVTVARLGAGITSQIGAGENSGRKLEHDFVVLSQQTAPLKANGAQASAVVTLAQTIGDAPRKAIAVWITRRGQLQPVQATGGWLDSR